VRLSHGDRPHDSHRSPVRYRMSAEVDQSIRALLRSQRFAVLGVQQHGQPYGYLVAYAVSEDLSMLAFPTSVATHKFRLLLQQQDVALVVDNRDTHPQRLTAVEAITATGRARPLDREDEKGRWIERLAARHRELGDFLGSPSTAVFCVDVQRYAYVTRFQQVALWAPLPAPP
jgi:nitroimidazol reductase NimA-like FMN-containing flavoprotein (pyridoxamine 5'-phosphate oxidase superfamily)